MAARGKLAVPLHVLLEAEIRRLQLARDRMLIDLTAICLSYLQNTTYINLATEALISALDEEGKSLGSVFKPTPSPTRVESTRATAVMVTTTPLLFNINNGSQLLASGLMKNLLRAAVSDIILLTEGGAEPTDLSRLEVQVPNLNRVVQWPSSRAGYGTFQDVLALCARPELQQRIFIVSGNVDLTQIAILHHFLSSPGI